MKRKDAAADGERDSREHAEGVKDASIRHIQQQEDDKEGDRDDYLQARHAFLEVLVLPPHST
jgi:hypothetical protein